MSDDNKQNSDPGVPDGDEFSLESILAEFKGSAYIDGDKKTPPDILNEKTEKIIMEVMEGNFAGTEITSDDQPPEKKNVAVQRPKAENDGKNESSSADFPAVDLTENRPIVKKAREPVVQPKEVVRPQKAVQPKEPAEQPVKSVEEPQKAAESEEADGEVKKPAEAVENFSTEVTDSDIMFFDSYRYASPEQSKETEEAVSEAIEDEEEIEQKTQKKARKLFSIFSKKDYGEDEEEYDDYEEEPEPEEVFEEPDLKSAGRAFSAKCNSYSLRALGAGFLSVLMAVVTFLSSAGVKLPFGLGTDLTLISSLLLIMLLVVMMLGMDLLIYGIIQIFKGSPGAESLVSVSCVVTVIAAFLAILKKNTGDGLPFCAVSAFSLAFALWGEKTYYRALTETLKTAVAAAEPFGVTGEFIEEINKVVLKKTPGRISGFYNNLIQADICETVYHYASPMLLIASLVFSFLTSVGHGMPGKFLHNLSVITAASASFSAFMAFAVPFGSVAKRARFSGAAVAGWGGAEDIYYSDGACITDDDLFPTGTLSMGGIKIFEEVQPEKAIRYTSSLIIASGSGLARVFAELLKKQGMSLIKVEDFACYEGGVGAVIRGERVITGSAAFMNLMGIRVPGTMNMKNAVFTAVNDKLIAVFAVNYVPVNSVRNALVSVLDADVKLFFAMRDFNITPLMLQQKFKVSVDDIEYMPVHNTYSISDDGQSKASGVAALLSREGLGPYVESITGGVRLRKTSRLATILSVVSTVIGVILMFFMCWSNSVQSASAGNLLLYMLSMLIVVRIACGFSK